MSKFFRFKLVANDFVPIYWSACLRDCRDVLGGSEIKRLIKCCNHHNSRDQRFWFISLQHDYFSTRLSFNKHKPLTCISCDQTAYTLRLEMTGQWNKSLPKEMFSCLLRAKRFCSLSTDCSLYWSWYWGHLRILIVALITIWVFCFHLNFNEIFILQDNRKSDCAMRSKFRFNQASVHSEKLWNLWSIDDLSIAFQVNVTQDFNVWHFVPSFDSLLTLSLLLSLLLLLLLLVDWKWLIVSSFVRLTNNNNLTLSPPALDCFVKPKALSPISDQNEERSEVFKHHRRCFLLTDSNIYEHFWRV